MIGPSAHDNTRRLRIQVKVGKSKVAPFPRAQRRAEPSRGEKSSRLYPVSGDGLVALSRDDFVALMRYIRYGPDFAQAERELDGIGIRQETRRAVRVLAKAIQDTKSGEKGSEEVVRISEIRDVTIQEPLDMAALRRTMGLALSVAPSSVRPVDGTGDEPVLLEVRETEGEYRRQVRAYIDITQIEEPPSDQALALTLARILGTSVMAATDDGVPGRYHRVKPSGEIQIVETDEDAEAAGRVDVVYEYPRVYSPGELSTDA